MGRAAKTTRKQKVLLILCLLIRLGTSEEAQAEAPYTPPKASIQDHSILQAPTSETAPPIQPAWPRELIEPFVLPKASIQTQRTPTEVKNENSNLGNVGVGLRFQPLIEGNRFGIKVGGWF